VDRLEEQELADAAGSVPSLSAAVQQLPGMGAVGRDAYTSAPTIRGWGRDRSLILLEGVRLSSDRGVGPTGSFIDPFLLRSLSIVRGASGVAYGSGAIGGVLSVGLGDVDPEPGGSLRLGGSTNGSGGLAAGRVHGSAFGKWRADVGAFYRTQNDCEFSGGFLLPRGDARNSGFSHGGGTLVAERPARGGTVRVAAVVTAASDIGRPTTLRGRIDTIATEDHALASVRYARDRAGDRDEWTLGAHRPETVNRTERSDDAGVPTRTSWIENVSTDLSLSGLRERPAGSGSWLLGLDAFTRQGVDAVETTVRYLGGVEQSPEGVDLVKNAYRADLGAYGAWKRSFGHLGEWVLGARVDWAHRRANDRSSRDWASPSAHVGIVHPLDDTWALTAMASHSFRAPRIQELYFEGDRPGGSRLANPGLEPERVWSLEGGVRAGGGGWSGRLVGWGSFASDLIVQLPVDASADTLRHENAAQARILGVEGELQWKPADGRGRASAAYAYVHGEDDGDPLPDIPAGELRLTAEVRVAGEARRRTITVWGAMRAGAAKTPPVHDEKVRWWSHLLGATDVGGDEIGHPGFARWDVGVRARPAERVTVDLSVTNLVDSHHQDRPERDSYPAPGRSFRVELTLGE
jgi:outer membrane receptor protein involved in Fe transport